MESTFEIKTPATITANCRGSIFVTNEKGELWYFRDYNTNCPDIVKFNLQRPGKYRMNANLIKIEDMKKADIDIKLPPAERYHNPKGFTFKYVPGITSPSFVKPTTPTGVMPNAILLRLSCEVSGM